MSRYLHSQQIAEGGRVTFGGEERDKHLRTSIETFDRAQERKLRRQQKKVRNMVRAAEGKSARGAA